MVWPYILPITIGNISPCRPKEMLSILCSKMQRKSIVRNINQAGATYSFIARSTGTHSTKVVDIKYCLWKVSRLRLCKRRVPDYK